MSSFGTDTIREALKQEKVTDGLALHSDQGAQYTSKSYFDLTQEYHVAPSVSSPVCPCDNAAMENFFSTFKTECLYRAHFSTQADVEQLVTEYVHFYNLDRISSKNGLTPIEIRCKTAKTILILHQDPYYPVCYLGYTPACPVLGGTYRFRSIYFLK